MGNDNSYQIFFWTLNTCDTNTQFPDWMNPCIIDQMKGYSDRLFVSMEQAEQVERVAEKE